MKHQEQKSHSSQDREKYQSDAAALQQTLRSAFDVEVDQLDEYLPLLADIAIIGNDPKADKRYLTECIDLIKLAYDSKNIEMPSQKEERLKKVLNRRKMELIEQIELAYEKEKEDPRANSARDVFNETRRQGEHYRRTMNHRITGANKLNTRFRGTKGYQASEI